jgi:Tfp pilus assembly PilM family ATPase
MLADRFGTAVEEFDPFKTIMWDANKVDADVAEAASTGAVAVGLALRRVGDR